MAYSREDWASSSSSAEEDQEHGHELDYSHSEVESFEITFANFSRKDGAKVGRLNLSHNQLRLVPRKMGVFKHLHCLDLSNNLLDSLSPDILKLAHLRVLIAKNNRLTADGLPKDLYQLTELQHINLGGNPLGRIPEVIVVMSGLVHLQLGSCEIRDIPKNVHHMSNLQTLYLGGNQLQAIPEEIGFLPSLRTLHLNHNNLEHLPPSLANLSQLICLSLHRNRLSSLPSEIIKLGNLRELSLRDNPLIRHFIRYLIFQPASLQELAGRVIKAKSIPFQGLLPKNLVHYLNTAHQCVNSRCRGVYFDSRLEHVKFVDFCGKYKLPFMEYLCSSRCVPTLHPELNDTPNEQEADMIKKVLLG